MEYAEARGAKIMNCSWRLFSDQTSLRLEMEAMNEVLFVCSAGNESADLDDPTNLFLSYPSLWKLENSISVGGCLPNDTPTTHGGGPGADGSSFGATTVNIFAPGDLLTSLGSAPPGAPVPNDGTLVAWGGTSGAAPFVTGVAALVWQRYPTWKPLTVKNQILSTADGPAQGVIGYVGKCTSNGRLNAQRALEQECE